MRIHAKQGTIAAALTAAVVLFSCTKRPQGDAVLRLEGETMGTIWHATLVLAEEPDSARTGSLQATVQNALDAVNGAMSTYLETSDLSRLAHAKPTERLQVSPLTWECLGLARDLHTASGGAFDPTVGPLVQLWGFGPGRTAGDRDATSPDPKAWQAARLLVGLEDWHFDSESQRVGPSRPGAELDLSAIAKGYGVDQAAKALRSSGIDRFLIEVGGELVTQGERPGGGPWRLVIESPFPDLPEWETRIELLNQALATSGDYRNFRVLPDGSRIAHTIDPRTGNPVLNPPASASVVASNCAQADGWATALSVLGEAGLELIEKEANLEARLVLVGESGQSPRVLTTSHWPGKDVGVNGEATSSAPR